MLSFRNTDKFNDLNKKKPAAPGPHAPATVQFPGFAVPAKAAHVVFLNPDRFNDLNKKKPAAPGPHAPATVQFPGFAVPAKAGWLSFRIVVTFQV